MRLDRVTDDTPVGTRVVLIDDQKQAHLTETRSVPWRVCGVLIVKVNGRSGGYRGDRCFVLPEQGTETRTIGPQDDVVSLNDPPKHDCVRVSSRCAEDVFFVAERMAYSRNGHKVQWWTWRPER
jgi:hypothetical protein